MDALMHVTAKLTYLAPDSEAPAFLVGAPGVESKRIGQYAETPVQIRNARLLPALPMLDAHGFTLQRHRTRDVDFHDDAAVEREYRPQVADLLARLTGAEEVIVFDHTVRIDAAHDSIRRPARHVHNDYTAASAIQRIIDLVGGDAAVPRLRKRFVQLNFWRPLDVPAVSAPLAVLDARSIAEGELVKADIVFPDRKGQIYELVHSPAHRWFYFPDMTPDEALIIKGYDSDPGAVARRAPHTAFDNPHALPGTPPRKSVELRAFAFFS